MSKPTKPQMPAHCCPACGRALDGPAPKNLLPYVLASPSEHRILAEFERTWPRYVSTGHLIDVLYAADPNGGPLQPRAVIGTHIARLRRRLAPYGWTITHANPREGDMSRKLERIP